MRRALGATTNDVLNLVITSAARLIGIGAVVGLALAASFSRLIATMLFGVQPLDAATFGLVAVVLVITGALAIAGPAWRATRIDPRRSFAPNNPALRFNQNANRMPAVALSQLLASSQLVFSPRSEPTTPTRDVIGTSTPPRARTIKPPDRNAW